MHFEETDPKLPMNSSKRLSCNEDTVVTISVKTKIRKTDHLPPADEEPTPVDQALSTQQKELLVKERNQLSARRSRERRMAYLLNLEFELQVAHLRIQRLELELRAARADVAP